MSGGSGNYLNAVCTVCGGKYHVCNDCRNTRTFTPWRTVADSMNCYRIYLILLDYTNGYLDARAAGERLKGCDLSGMETFAEHIRKAIREILAAEASQGQISAESNETLRH